RHPHSGEVGVGRAAVAEVELRTPPAVEHAARLLQVALAAQRLVGDLALVDRHLVALEDVLPVDLARVEDRLAPAAADRLELLERVRDLQQATATRERHGLEVGPDA